MRFKKLAVAFAASGGAAALALFAVNPATAQAAGASTSYEANLQALNGSNASGTLMLTLNGDQATITEHTTGSRGDLLRQARTRTCSTFTSVPRERARPRPPTRTATASSAQPRADRPTESIGATLSTSGPTTPASGTVLTIAPSGATIDYSRTFTLDAATVASIQAKHRRDRGARSRPRDAERQGSGARRVTSFRRCRSRRRHPRCAVRSSPRRPRPFPPAVPQPAPAVPRTPSATRSLIRP